MDKTESEKKNSELKMMQSWPLEKKIQVTQARILEWYQHYDGKVFVSFSGGKDSTVLLDLARRCFPDIKATFIDTGLEFPELREFVKTIENVDWIKPEMNFKQVLEKFGYPVIGKEVSHAISDALKKPDGREMQKFDENSELCQRYDGRYCLAKYKHLLNAPFKISHMCCDIMKKKPSKKYEKETGLKPMIGVMACESRLRKTQWMKDGCNAFHMDRPRSFPMSFWFEEDVLEYIHRFGIPYAKEIYGDIYRKHDGTWITTGEPRTGCIFCMFGVHREKHPNKFVRLQRTHPTLYNYVMKPKDEGGLGIKEILKWLGLPYEQNRIF